MAHRGFGADSDAARQILHQLRADLPGTLIALDFDGTLAPIVPDPLRSRPVDGVVEAMTALAEAGAQLAVITGRDARTVVDLGGLAAVPGLAVEGIYGVEQWQDGTLSTPDTPEPMVRLREQLPSLVTADGIDPDVWIEDKRLSLVVHGRLAQDPERALDPLRAGVATLAGRLGLEFHPGNGVIELRLPGYDKGAALHRLVSRLHPRQVLVAGDDVGDLPAFDALADLRATGLTTWAVAVGDLPEVCGAADLVVADPSEFRDLLRALAAPD